MFATETAVSFRNRTEARFSSRGRKAAFRNEFVGLLLRGKHVLAKMSFEQ